MGSTNHIIYYKGGLSVILKEQDICNYSELIKIVPNNLISYKIKRDGINHHITVISSIEYNQIEKELLESKLLYITNTLFTINIIGLGSNNSCYYLICISPELDNLRKELNLPSKDFHITLGFDKSDNHSISKGIDTLIVPVKNIISIIIENLGLDIQKNIKILKELYLRFPDNFSVIKNLANEFSKQSNYSEAFLYARLLIDLFPNNAISIYMILKLSIKKETYDIDLLKTILQNIQNIQNVNQKKIAYEIVEIINKLSIQFNFYKSSNAWFEIISYNEHNKKFIPIKFVGNFDYSHLLKVITDFKKCESYEESFVFTLNTILIDSRSTQIYIKKEHIGYELTELPNNFSKIDINLYGSGIISERHIILLKTLKINYIINLIGEETPKEDIQILCKNYDIKLYHIGFPDKTACNMDIFLKIQDIIVQSSGCGLIHCLGGIGRTNMILAGYLIKAKQISPSEAISILKQSRKVIMVPDQIMLLKKYYGYVQKSCIEVENMEHMDFTGLILMVGLPCSGKSTIALDLFTKYYNSSNKDIIHLNQDEIGKTACEQILCKKAKSADLIILDKCNLTTSDRTSWIKMYKNLTNKKITVVFINLELELLLSRLHERKNHLTLTSNDSKIIIEMNKKLTSPIKSEGWDELIQINDLNQLEQFYHAYISNSNSNSEHLIKFPRTKHIVNLGAMTRDDLLMGKLDINDMLSGMIYVEEKIDGANIGFRLDSTGKIIAQNRSHYVCSATHSQFKKLDQWIETNKFDLQNILQKGNYIIYGEWLYAKHSIHYTKLSDYFIMFDLYNINTNAFESRETIERIIENTSISLVPLIYYGRANIETLKSLIQTESKFYDGIIEGIYVRSYDNENKLKYRGKIVRSDFISGDDHWTKGKQIINTVENYK